MGVNEPQSEGDTRRHWRRTVWGLAVGETLVWAASYYLFPAMLPHWEQTMGWSKTAMAGAFTLALLVSAATSPLVGTLIDRGLGRQVLVGATGLLALLVALLSRVEALWQFYLIWICLGSTMAGALYDPCFAYLTRRYQSGARRAITQVTLVAGFAGTVAFPGVHGLSVTLGWRGACLGFAVAVMAIALPLMWFATAEPVSDTPRKAATQGEQRQALHQALGNPVFWALAVAFAMVALNHGALITQLLPLLAERGVATPLAVLAASLMGPMQVVGRIIMLSVERRLGAEQVCLVLFACLLAASSLLLFAGDLTVLILLFVVLQGAGYGVTSIVRPVITAEFLGYTHFGAISGAQATLVMTANALAATVAALAWRWAGYQGMLLVCLGFAGVGLAAYLMAWRGRIP